MSAPQPSTPKDSPKGVELSPVTSPTSTNATIDDGNASALPESAAPKQHKAQQPTTPKSPTASSPTTQPKTVTALEPASDSLSTHEKMLAQIRADLDKVLDEEETKTKILLARREKYISRMWWVVLIGQFVTFLPPLIIWLAWFEPLSAQIPAKYNYKETFFDLILCLSVRFVAGLLGILTTRSDEKRVTLFHSSAYWSAAIVFVLNITKLMIISWRRSNRIVLAVVSMLCSTVIFILHHLFIPLDEENFDDDDDEKEQAIQRKKLHAEALERADALQRRLTGPALEQHLITEAKRLKSYEYVEKMITRSHIQKRHESKVSALQFLGFLRPYFWPKGAHWIYHAIVIISWILLIGSKACAIIAPLYIGYAVDQLVDDSVMPWKNISLYVSIGLIGQLLKQVQNALYVKVKQQAFIEISSSLLRHILSLSHSYHHSKSLGKTVRSLDRGITSADNVTTYLFLLVLPSIGEAFAVFVIFYVKFKAPLLAAIIFVHLIAYAVTTVQMTLMRKPLRKKMTSQDNRYHAIFTESLTNYDLVRAFATEEVEVDKYTHSVTLYQRYLTMINVTLSLLNSVQQLIISSTMLTCLFVCAWEVNQGRLKIGAVSSVSGYVMSLYTPLGFLGTVYDMVVTSVIDCRHILELKRIQPEILDFQNATTLTLPTDGTPPVIEFKNVTFVYPGETGRGIHNVSFKIQGPVAFVGATGSGKSTVTRLLMRFYDPQSGEILINGQNIKYVTNQSLKDALCIIPQESTMFNSSILSNLKYGNPDATFEQVVQATKVAGIYDLIISFPQQFETVVGDSSKRLSGGERQRLSLARAILRSLRTAKITQPDQKIDEENPDLDEDGFPIMQFGGIVLADEFSSALDNETERLVQRGLKKLERGTTTIVIAHRLSTIAGIPEIIVMNDGSILEQGSHQDLLAKGGKYATLWNLQFDHGDDAVAAMHNNSNNNNNNNHNNNAEGGDVVGALNNANGAKAEFSRDSTNSSTIFGAPIAPVQAPKDANASNTPPAATVPGSQAAKRSDSP